MPRSCVVTAKAVRTYRFSGSSPAAIFVYFFVGIKEIAKKDINTRKN
jgi:hypothetical protein